MDHSLQGYLRRQTTESLQAMLQYCMRKENYENYRDAVLAILKVLQEREKQETEKDTLG